MVRYLFYTIGDLTYQSPLVFNDALSIAGYVESSFLQNES